MNATLLPPVLVLLVTAGAVLSASSAGELVRLRRQAAGPGLDDAADPINVMSVIHGLLFAGWVMAAAFGFGVPVALLLAAAGLLVQVVPTHPARSLAVRLGLGGFARLSLMTAAGVTMAAAAAYGAVVA